VLSGTGAPVALVKCSGFDIINSQFQKFWIVKLLNKSLPCANAMPRMDGCF
jgi:hypothetical protein